MSPLLVIICTHNPRRDFLEDTLDALQAQSLPRDDWDLLVIDNASGQRLDSWLNLDWHPRARIVREGKLGTAHARHRALLEARAADADLVLFVDDDNVLAPDYLERGLEFASTWPRLGCWGGQLLPRYEREPPAWLANYLKYLAIKPLAADQWANCVFSYDLVPPTAGCFVRGAVWRRYLELLAQDPRRLELGARGYVQLRGEDTDLVLTAVDLGLGLGRFCALRLEHLIPAGRLEPAYITDLVEGTVHGTGLLEYIRFARVPRAPARNLFEQALLHWRAWRLPEPLRSIRRAELRGRMAARRAVLAWQQQQPGPAVPPQLQPSVGRA